MGSEPADAQRTGRAAPKRAKRNVYVYLDNDRKVHAPFDAQRLASRVAALSRVKKAA
ncbi:MAG: hypothetical protein ACREMA_02785 [Longimicrobiales bacterium]